MSINDIKEELGSIRNNFKVCITEEIKPLLTQQKNSVQNIEDFLDSKIVNMYQRPWNKLEAKLKKTKIKEYYSLLLSQDKIEKSDYNKELESCLKCIDLKRKLKVEYDHDICEIKNIV